MVTGEEPQKCVGLLLLPGYIIARVRSGSKGGGREIKPWGKRGFDHHFLR